MERTTFFNLRKPQQTSISRAQWTVFFGQVSGSLWDTKSASFRALALACCSRSNFDLMTFKAI